MSSATTQLVYSGAAAAVQQLYSCTLDTSAGCWRWPPSVPLVTLCGHTLVDTDGPNRTTVSDFVSIQTLIRHPHHLLHTTQPLFSPKTPLKAPYISVRVYRFPLPVCGVWPGRCHITRHPHGLAAAAWRPAQHRPPTRKDSLDNAPSLDLSTKLREISHLLTNYFWVFSSLC